MSNPPKPHDGHEPAPPPESDPTIQTETDSHDPSQQVQPPDADAIDLYGDI